MCKVWCKVSLILLLLPGQICPMTGLTLPATEWTQLLNHAQLVIQAAHQVRQIELALESLKNATLQGKLLVGMDLVHAVDELTQLAHVVRQGQGLSYTMSGLDNIFRRMYPGYLQAGVDFQPQYNRWSRTNMDTIAGVLAALHMHYEQMSNDQNSRMIIKNFASSAEGQNQILQSGVLMADQELQQLMGLRQLMAMQTTLVADAAGYKQNLDDVQRQMQVRMFQPVNPYPTN